VGIGAVLDTEAFGRRVVHLHPKHLGLLLELDEIDDPDVWFWDDIQPAEDTDPLVADVAAVEMASPDPEALAALWASVFEVEVDRSGDAPVVWLGSRAVRFIQGDRTQMTAIELAAGRADPSTQVIAGVETRVVRGTGS